MIYQFPMKTLITTYISGTRTNEVQDCDSNDQARSYKKLNNHRYQ